MKDNVEEFIEYVLEKNNFADNLENFTQEKFLEACDSCLIEFIDLKKIPRYFYGIVKEIPAEVKIGLCAKILIEKCTKVLKELKEIDAKANEAEEETLKGMRGRVEQLQKEGYAYTSMLTQCDKWHNNVKENDNLENEDEEMELK